MPSRGASGVAYGERGRGVTPFRSIPPLHSGVPPNFGERKGRLGRGRSPGLESRGLSWARGRGGGLSVPRGAGWSWRLGSVCVLEVEAEAVQGSRSGGTGRRGCLGVHTHLRSVGRTPGRYAFRA